MRSRFDRLLRVAPATVALLTVGVVATMLASRPDRLAQSFGLDFAEESARLVIGCMVVASVAFLAAAYKLLRTLLASGKSFVEWRKRNEPQKGFAEAGVVMIEFTLLAPTVWLIMAIVVQLALIAEATLVVRYAAYTAVRAAIVRTERNAIGQEDLGVSPGKVEESAKLVLCSLSPKIPNTDNDSAHAMLNIFAAQNGVWGDKNFHRRYQYADDSTTVKTTLDDPPIEMPFVGDTGLPNLFAPKLVECEVTYLYATQIPGVTLLPGILQVSDGYKAFKIIQRVRMQSTGARQSNPIGVAGTMNTIFP